MELARRPEIESLQTMAINEQNNPQTIPLWTTRCKKKTPSEKYSNNWLNHVWNYLQALELSHQIVIWREAQKPNLASWQSTPQCKKDNYVAAGNTFGQAYEGWHTKVIETQSTLKRITPEFKKMRLRWKIQVPSSGASHDAQMLLPSGVEPNLRCPLQHWLHRVPANARRAGSCDVTKQAQGSSKEPQHVRYISPKHKNPVHKDYQIKLCQGEHVENLKRRGQAGLFL